MKRAMMALGAAIAAGYLLALGALWLAQRDLLFQPSGEAAQPADVGLPQATPLDVRTIDGETLRAWHIEPKQGRLLFLYLHGNGGALADRAARFRALTARGDGLFAIAWRGYPGSSGEPSEEGLARDADAALAHALSLGHRPSGVVIVGESLGSAVGVALASRRQVGALILEAPFSSAADVAASIYWMFPVRLLMSDPFRADEKIAHVRAPVLLVHGTADRVTPISFARRLFEKAREPKTFLEVPGGGHAALDPAMDRALDWAETTLSLR